MIIIPEEWFVVFKKKSQTPWVNWIPGRFKHCFAMAFVPELQCWLFVEFAFKSGTAVALLPNAHADAWLGEACEDAVVVGIHAGMARGVGLGLWCVPAIAHIIGLNSCALRPDGLFRDCLRNGGRVIIPGD